MDCGSGLLMVMIRAFDIRMFKRVGGKIKERI